MHPFWETTDVVSEVISLLSKADQARMAQVNTALWEIAIPYIWRDVQDIRHIFNLFPSDLWNEVNEPALDQASPPPLNRELQESDWTRFFLHSNKTRTTRCTIPIAVPSEIWSHRLFSASFPSLEALTIFAFDPVDEYSSSIIASLLRPSLHRIEFSVETLTAESLLISTLRAIAENKTLSPKEMAFHFAWIVGPSLGDIVEGIASQTSLRSLKLSGHSDIMHLAGCAKDLPFLEELEVDGWALEDLEGYNELYLRSLKTFTTTGNTVLIRGLLRAIGSNRPARLALHFYDPSFEDTSPEPLSEMERFRPHLIHLGLKIEIRGSWTGQWFQPLLNLAELQTVELEIAPVFGGSMITDDLLRQMIDAWPNLTRLVLRVPFMRITLTSLDYIAIHCPNLRKLSLSFGACKEANTTFSWDVDPSRFTQNALELFDVMKSTFDEGDEERSANLFRCWWPKARLCRTSADEWGVECTLTWPGRTKDVGQS